MNKAQLINAISEDANLSKEEARKAIDAFINNVSKALSEGDRVVLSGFGSFLVDKRKARTGTHPATQEKIEIPEKNIVKFNPGNQLVEKIQK